ncbi:SCO2521 family protein [Kineosporia succinea]|uniref:Uncharacterized protein n=1 Tax=Kineosporia succinea TaxID=84632 RepID=A0ABT9PDL7_9ACTN|nr:SCO2521 family protein [Kineosporia succinea]MDP9830793.1 hypothetical protein [Kineosporia succinea]
MSVTSQPKPALGTPALSVSVDVAGPVLALGEIRTGLLPHSGPLPSDATADLLTPGPGRPPRRWERPVAHVAAPHSFTGVDCWMPSAVGRRLRGVGTVSTEVRVTGGQVVQAHTRTGLRVAGQKRRLPWSHYLAQPGTVETWGPVRAAELAEAFFAEPAASGGVLDLGGPSVHRLNQIRGSARLDRLQTYRPEQTRLRWVAVPETGTPSVVFTLRSRAVHTLLVRVPPEVMPQADELCLDIALHDWLLSSLLGLIERAGIGRADRSAVVATLAPAVDHLIHAWLPGARLGPVLAELRAEADRVSGLSAQWASAVSRVRDQIALAAVEQAVRQRPRPSRVGEP